MTRLDRYGDPIEDEVDLPVGNRKVSVPHDPECRDGWLGEDARGRPIPCLVCRPHLRGRLP